jgi:predicted alpha/beta hydrolase
MYYDADLLHWNDRPHMLQALCVLGVAEVVSSSRLGLGVNFILMRAWARMCLQVAYDLGMAGDVPSGMAEVVRAWPRWCRCG